MHTSANDICMYIYREREKKKRDIIFCIVKGYLRNILGITFFVFEYQQMFG